LRDSIAYLARYAIARPSHWWISQKRFKSWIMQFPKYSSPIYLVFCGIISSRNFNGFPEQKRKTSVGWGIKLFTSFVRQYVENGIKTVRDSPKLLVMTNRKFHMRFRLTPKTMIVDDLELLKVKVRIF